MEGLRPYELWKKQIIIPKDTVYVDENRDRKLDYDQSSKDHLTKLAGKFQNGSYKSLQKTYHGKQLTID